MAGLGRKVFTAGDVLTASDVQNYLMDQTVMYFAGTAARSSAIATPTTGMTTYIGTTGTASIPQIETYTGSAWQTPYGLTQVANVTVSAAASVTIDNVFTSAFDNYLLVLNVKNNANNDTALTFQFRSAGSTIAGTAYSKNNIQSYGTTVSATGSNGTSNWNFGSVSQTSYSQTVATIGNPAVAKSKALQFQNAHAQTAFSALDTNTGYGVNTTATAYDGLILTVSAGTLTGTLKIYGYRNS